MATNSSGFYVPSYLDDLNGPNDFENLADSIMHIGNLRFKQITGRSYTVTASDFDYVLRCDAEAIIYIPEDKDMPAPIGAQIAVLNYSEKSVGIERVGDVVIAGTERRVVEKWRIGVLVKYDANFWLLSLGSGAGSQGTTTPTPPNLVTALGVQEGIALTWQKPVDDGGAAITAYIAETSTDGKVYVSGGAFPSTQLSGTITGLKALTVYSVRIKAQNSNGLSEPSNVLSANVPPSFNAATGGAITTVPNYNGTGQTWKVHTFTSTDSLLVTSAVDPFAILCVGAGGAGGQSIRDFEPDGPEHGGGGGGGGAVVQNKNVTLSVGRIPVNIGSPTSCGGVSANAGGAGGRGTGENFGHNGGTSGNGNPGGTQTITGYGGASGGGAGGAGVDQQGGPPAYSDVSGVNTAYGAGGNGGGTYGGNGGPGYVVVAYRVA